MKIVQEFYARGFEFLPIDLYNSEAVKFTIVDGKLLPPFSSIDGMGAALLGNHDPAHMLHHQERSRQVCPQGSLPGKTMINSELYTRLSWGCPLISGE